MSLDFSWFWEALTSISSTIQNFFTSLWAQVQNISNTGQGILYGLTAFGTQIWDAIVKWASTFGEWFHKAFERFKEGLENLGNWLGQTIGYGLQVIGSAISWISGQIYNFGNWLWNGILWIGQQISNIFTDIWNWIASTISNLLTTLADWYNNIRTALNNWFTGMFVGFRSKLKQSIIANITLATAYKSIEKITDIKSISEFPTAIAKIFINPVLGYLGGTFMAEVVDRLIPTPSTSTIEFIPPLTLPTFTPPTLSITVAPQPTPPTAPPTLPALYPFTGIFEETLDMPTLSIELETSFIYYSQGFNMPSITVEMEVA